MALEGMPRLCELLQATLLATNIPQGNLWKSSHRVPSQEVMRWHRGLAVLVSWAKIRTLGEHQARQ